MEYTMVPQLPGTFFVALRQDFILLMKQCHYRKEKSKASPHCKALILTILDHWTYDNLRKQRSASIHITLLQWQGLMYGMFGRKVIMDSLEELCQEGYIERQAFKTGNGGRDQYLYTLNHERVINALSTLKNAPCETVQSSQVNDQHAKVHHDSSQMHLATCKNEPSSSVATFTSAPLIEEIETSKETNRKTKEESSLDPSILSWISEVKIPVRSQAKLQSHAKKLAGMVTSCGELKNYFAFAQVKYSDAHLGNLASDALYEEWRKTPDAAPAILSLTEESHGVLEAEIKREYPMLVTQPYDTEFELCLVIWKGRGDEDYVLVRDALDWQYWREDKSFMEQAIAHGMQATTLACVAI